MDQENRRDKELFDALKTSKKKKRRRGLLRALIIAGVLALAVLVAFFYLRAKVRARIASDAEDVLSFAAVYGNISTRVTGTGTILDTDTEELSVPAGVEIDEVLVKANTRLREGDAIATVDLASVYTAMADVSDELASLDEQLTEASDDTLGIWLTAGATGRVKKIYAADGDDVAACMYEHGALALLSLDGFMCVDIETGALQLWDDATVKTADGTEYPGEVWNVAGSTATVVTTDKGPLYGEEVSVLGAGGAELGRGTLEIHSPLKVTGLAGTVAHVQVSEGEYVSAGNGLFSLRDTDFSARYEKILRERRDKEETLLELLALRQTGALCAPFDGTILTVDYDDGDGTSSASSAASASAQAASSAYASYASAYTGAAAGMGTSAAAASASPSSKDGETQVVTMARDEKMTVTISVDESDILSLRTGLPAELSIDAIGEKSWPGTVTEIDRTAQSSSGVTTYSAEITFDKAERMLGGMTADVTINIEGTENVLIVPAEAVHRTSAIAYVFMSYDSETGEYGDMRTVETGISNDDYVEIVSGLEEGEIVFYEEEESPFPFAFNQQYGSNGRPGSQPRRG